MTFFTCCCWSTTTRKGRMYKNVTSCTKAPYPNQSHLWYLWPTMVPQRKNASGHPRWPPPIMAWPTTEPTLPPSKLRLLVARTDGWLPVINNTSTMTTWVKGCQLSTIRVRKWPVWSMTCVDDHPCGLSTRWKYLPLWYLSVFRPLVEVWGLSSSSVT